MDRNEFGGLLVEVHERISALNQTKGVEYAGHDDALENFKRHASALGLKPEQIWAVYASKHWDAIISYVRTGAVLSEPIEGRILDCVLYLCLLLGLERERMAPEIGPGS
jgi:hypothetical protein